MQLESLEFLNYSAVITEKNIKSEYDLLYRLMNVRISEDVLIGDIIAIRKIESYEGYHIERLYVSLMFFERKPITLVNDEAVIVQDLEEPPSWITPEDRNRLQSMISLNLNTKV